MDYPKEFNELSEAEQIVKLKRVIEWWDDYADCISHRENEYACEYADEKEVERYPEPDKDDE